MKTLTLKGAEYRIGKIDTITQWHLTRRLAPVIATLGLSISALRDGAKLGLDDFAPLLGPISTILANMTDEQSTYIINHTLKVVTRQQSEKMWAPVQSQGGGLMFEDIDMGVMLRLVIEVLWTNLEDFLTGLGDVANLPSS